MTERNETQKEPRTLIDIDEIMDAVKRDDCIGFCTACGLEHGGCEPDMENHICDSCGQYAVFGAEQLLFYYY
tara:strand:+ start:2255 stop:2470 length:216 start_codon:yes stop_codon:yes gene_type:complete